MNREAIFTALFAKLAAAADFQTTGRRLKTLSNVKPPNMPALFMAERAQTYEQTGRGKPPKVTLTADVFIYANAAMDPNVIGATTLNTLLDAIDVAMQPDSLDSTLTLGNLVTHCWIEGEVLCDPGDIDGAIVAVIPIKILATI